ncbi:50S ribosomal protein L22 [Pyrobaculum neutrophilum]|uniref:Large ribosomal subunit protein uL22 n=1 Tax=Pyrobaculum neutrophilum (strain DSM 2338 / JCM 9278 / NBRC 100436 / V24Sta) TaxID=444157 RepID=RL22_PYRNV|nr:50S ribosomal protein L22 [Pyrobaculum neutrophilum]B1YD24.1 RecName: Full=Large ribosomal subunit protein uL22; AltName: Full=50S ribosomal protein L22 [Pyrobaculum neutrophilum V24Sta]ACB39687.1 ribosomal protein L22 [Pyrobaculum neutrophilum V24Sta]
MPRHQNYSLSDEAAVQLVFRKYGVKVSAEQIAKAYAPEQKMSWKKSVEVARFIEGMTLRQAKSWLEDVVKMKRPIPIRTFKKKQAHHATPWSGWPVAKWPVKVARRFLDLLENLENNARFRGLDVERVVIVHAAAHKGYRIHNIMPRAFGRATRFDEQTVNVEVIAAELPQQVVPKRYRLNLVKR